MNDLFLDKIYGPEPTNTFLLGPILPEAVSHHFKTDITKVGLVFLISNFFITKMSLANKWMRKKIPLVAPLKE